jgi:hypothetical protein
MEIINQSIDKQNSEESQKLYLEIEQLKEENRILKRPQFLKASFYATFIPLIISILVNIGQVVQNRNQQKEKEKELSLNVEKWRLEKEGLESQISNKNHDREKADSELIQVKKDIENTETTLMEEKVKQIKIQGELDQLKIEGKSKNNPRVIAAESNVKLQEGLIKNYENELAEYKNRRTELVRTSTDAR